MKSPSPFGLRLRIALFTGLVLVGFIALMDLTLAALVRAAIRAGQSDIAISQCGAAIEDSLNALATRLRKPVFIYLCTGSAITLSLILLIVHRVAVRPLSRITRAVEEVAEGALNVRVPIQGSGELAALGVRFNQMTRTISEQRGELLRRIAQIEAANLELRNTEDRLISASRLASVGTLAAGVAHEIGNPIAGILGLLDVLDAEKDPENAAKYRELIRKETRRVDHIISELLNYARPGRSVSGTPGQSVLSDAIEHVQQLVKAQPRFDRIELRIDIEPALPCTSMSAQDITQLVVNLLLNAAEAMEGQGRITLTARRSVSPSCIVLTVEDTGPGVSPEDRTRIFEPFFSHRRSEGGSGLGLAICQRICERSGGDIHLDAAFEQGARFIVSLPMSEAEN
jgi:signal transduction histidine kinase